MIRLKGKEYSGYIVSDSNEQITVVLSSNELFKDIAEMMIGVTEVTDISSSGIETVHVVTSPISASIVSPNLYAIRFSTKPTVTQQLEAKNQELSDAIDDIIVSMLEG